MVNLFQIFWVFNVYLVNLFWHPYKITSIPVAVIKSTTWEVAFQLLYLSERDTVDMIPVPKLNCPGETETECSLVLSSSRNTAYITHLLQTSTEYLLPGVCVCLNEDKGQSGKGKVAQSVEPNKGLFSWARREKGCQCSRLSVDRVKQTTAILMTIKKSTHRRPRNPTAGKSNWVQRFREVLFKEMIFKLRQDYY